jgi:hypothetical protein
MTNSLRTEKDYELYLYSLVEHFPSIKRFTITFVRRGISLARVSGVLHFAHGVRMVVRERILYHRLPAVIDGYGYEIWRDNEKLYWYDSQPHPNEASLQSTHPHHKHIQPNIKHNRIPAVGMSFIEPNLPNLIKEVEALVESIDVDDGKS